MLSRSPALLIAVLAASLPCAAQEGDCNANGIPDRSDIEERGLPDCNENGLPDGCDVLPGLRFEVREFPDVWAGGIAAADLDADGDADLVEAGFGRRLLVRSNSGAGSAFSTRFVASRSDLGDVAVADLNGDGRMDVAGAGLMNVELFLLSGGALERSASVPVSGDPRRIAAADLDGDGDDDVAAAVSLLVDSPSDVLSLVLSAGETFQARNYAIPREPSGLALDDFDGDGDVDAAASSSSVALLSLFWNPGNGRLPPGVEVRLPRTMDEMVSGDLDGDGAADLVLAAAYPHQIVVLANNGAGAFEWIGENGLPERPFGLTALDLDGDGDEDVASATPGLTCIHWSAGGGILEPGPGVLVDASFLASGDFDDDGALDLASAGEDYFAVALQRGGELQEPMRFGRLGSAGGRTELIAVDLDADGDVDIASTNGDWNSFATSWMGPGGDLDGSSVHAAAGPVAGLRASDLDGDGLVDLVLGERVGQVPAPLIRWNAGAGRFAESLRLDGSAHAASIEIADVDGDGRTDLVAASPSSGRLAWIRNVGGRTFAAPVDVGTRSAPLLVRPVDLDGDRDTDLAVAGLRTIDLLVNDGRGSFSGEERVELEDVFGLFSSLEAADLDLDGDADLLSVLATSTWIHRNEGPAGFSGTGAARPRGPAYPIVVDLVGDPRPEIASRNPFVSGFSTLFALFSAPDGSYEVLGPMSGGAQDDAALSLGTADFDGDGISDLVTTDPFRGLVILLNRSGPPSSADADGNGRPDECRDPPFHRGEADGNGALDISDAIFILRHLFAGSLEPTCLDAADTNDDGGIDLTDAVGILLYLFASGPDPAPPGPPSFPCGADPGAHLGCLEYSAC